MTGTAPDGVKVPDDPLVAGQSGVGALEPGAHVSCDQGQEERREKHDHCDCDCVILPRREQNW